jgi:hypothetical protein
MCPLAAYFYYGPARWWVHPSPYLPDVREALTRPAPILDTVLMKIEFLSPEDDIHPENYNVDVLVHLDDGRMYLLLGSHPKQHLLVYGQ